MGSLIRHALKCCMFVNRARVRGHDGSRAYSALPFRGAHTSSVRPRPHALCDVYGGHWEEEQEGSGAKWVSDVSKLDNRRRRRSEFTILSLSHLSEIPESLFAIRSSYSCIFMYPSPVYFDTSLRLGWLKDFISHSEKHNLVTFWPPCAWFRDWLVHSLTLIWINK